MRYTIGKGYTLMNKSREAKLVDNVNNQRGRRMKTVEAKIPEGLDRRIDALVEQGWFRSRDKVLREALRRFLDAPQTGNDGRLHSRGHRVGAAWRKLTPQIW